MSRTATAEWKKVRHQRLVHDQANGVTTCPLCGVWLDYDHSRLPNSAEVDHIVAWIDSQDNSFENTRTVCRRCNQSKGGKLGNKRKRKITQTIKVETVIEW